MSDATHEVVKLLVSVRTLSKSSLLSPTSDSFNKAIACMVTKRLLLAMLFSSLLVTIPADHDDHDHGGDDGIAMMELLG